MGSPLDEKTGGIRIGRELRALGSVVQANRVLRQVRNPYSTINVTLYGKVTTWRLKK